jgi:serine phosphatase RsbU (regulator of sigma subunit)
VLQGLQGARPAEIISACLADLRKHLAHQPKGDDLSLLVLRHSEAPQA